MKVKEIFEDRYHDEWAKKQAERNRSAAKERKAAERQAVQMSKPPRVKKEKPDLWKIWKTVETAISNSFPDGDPIDHLPSDIDMDLVDAAVKQHAGTRGKGKAKYGMYDYLADMWEDSQADAVHDANVSLNAGKVPEHSPFFDVVNVDHHGFTGKEKIVKTPNPWK